jgi:hypothetical protein
MRHTLLFVLAAMSLAFAPAPFARREPVPSSSAAAGRICRENFLKIKVGMTQAEVERVFRRRPGDYSPDTAAGNALAYYPPSSGLVVYREPIRREAWRGDDGCVEIVFDANGRVWKKRAWWAR